MVVSEGAINNIMGGMENTAGVRLHSHRHKLKQRFDIVRKLGQGTYGKVQLAINKETGQEVAIKTIKKAKIETEQDLVRIRREIQIMSSVQHPQIIHIYEVFENREKMVLVMEYAAGGELYDYLSERKVLPELEARRVFRQVASAVYYCHKHKICHRDLKLENILLDLDGNAKIADFGLSNVFDDKQRLDTFCGSPLYASPEIVKGVPYVGPEVDCWSLGVLLYTLVYGAMPFDGSNFRRLVKQITQGDFYEPSTPATASSLIRHMLTVQSADRATIWDICNNWWVNEGYSESCLTQAEALANQTPVRLDLLLSLAPKHINSEHMLIQPDDEDVSQKSESERAPPNLKLPPPPALPDGEVENGVAPPLRSHSLGAVPPQGGVNVDLLLEKKKEKKKKSESSSKKPPSRPPPTEEDKKKKGSIEEASKKKESASESAKKESSTERVKKEEKVKKRESSTERIKKRDSSTERIKKRESSTERIKKRDSSTERIKKRDSSTEREKVVKKRDTPVMKKTSTSSLKAEEEERSSSIRGSKSSSKTPVPEDATSPEPIPELKPESLPEPKPTVPKRAPVAKTDSYSTPGTGTRKSSITGVKKPVGKTEPELKKDENRDTETLLKETAAKIEKTVVEDGLLTASPVTSSATSLITSPVTSPMTSLITSPIMSPPLTSPIASSSQVSSLATSPLRSRTGSESSTDANRPISSTRSDSGSRRQSKILSKAALFDPGLSSSDKSVSTPPKKISRPGALNMSDLAKKFEEKPSAGEKRGTKVVSPYKVSDARKAFENKTEKTLSDSSKRKASVGSSGLESASLSPKDSLPTSPRDSKPTSPTRVDHKAPVSTSSGIRVNKTLSKSDREVSPVKKASKSPSKDVSPLKKGEKSPPKEVSSIKRGEKSSPKKETSPTKIVSKPISKIRSASKLREEAKEIPVKIETSKPAAVPATGKDVPALSKPKKLAGSGPKSFVNDVSTTIPVRVESDSSDSESEAEKMLRQVSEKREKLEIAKKEKMKEVSVGKEPPVTPSTPVGGLREEAQEKEKYATLPKGFKAKMEPMKPASPKIFFPRVNSLEQSLSGDSIMKKSQMEIVLNQPAKQQQPISRAYDNNSNRSSFAEIHISDTPRPEYRTEVQHNVVTPQERAPTEPQLQRARRERIIPIMMEDDHSDAQPEYDARMTSSRSSMIQPSLSSSSSKASSVASSSRASSGFGVTPAAEKRMGAAVAPHDLIRKSRRERIIPIAVEGEGLLTPPISASTSTEKMRTFQRQGSSHSAFNRNRGFAPLDRAESFSSAGEDDDEEDDGFQILTAESLFSTLLSRVRSLTRKMANDDTRNPESGSNIRRAMNSDNPLSSGPSGSSGFWSSLYSPPGDMPGNRLSRGHSRDDDLFGGFGAPIWGRSMSRDASDNENTYSDSSAPFSTLPRGWRARRSGREESVLDGDKGISSFTPSRRQFYSRTLSRDLKPDADDPLKRPGARASWGDASPSLSTLPRPCATPGSTLPPTRYKEPIDRVTNTYNALNKSNIKSSDIGGSRDPFERPQSNAGGSSATPSGEATGRVGGQFDQRGKNLVASVASSSSTKDPQKPKKSVQQLKDLVNELEADPKEGSVFSDKGRVTFKLIPSGSKGQLTPPKPSKSLTSFQKQSSLPSHSGSNPNIVFNVTLCAPNSLSNVTGNLKENSKHKISNDIGLKTSKNSFSKNNADNQVEKDTIKTRILKQTETPASSLEKVSKNVFIPYNPNLNQSNTSHKNLYVDKQINTIPREKRIVTPVQRTNDVMSETADAKSEKYVAKVSDSRATKQASNHDSSIADFGKINGHVRGVDTLSDGLKSSRSIGQSIMKPQTDYQRKSSVTDSKNFLLVEPYRRNRSEDLQAKIEMANATDNLKDGTVRGPVKVYRKSRSRDITPAIEAASEKFTQVNSGTLKRISPFEAYRRSKSKELGSAIDMANSRNDLKAKSPPPTDISMSQFEKAKTSIEKKFEKAKSPTLESEMVKETRARSPELVKDWSKGLSFDIKKEKEKEPSKEKVVKDSEKPKSVYKIITSKFSRSLSNVGEERHEPKQTTKDIEEENEKDDKFKLRRPSRFLKSKMEKSSSKTSILEMEAKDDEDVDKSEKKSTKKLSNALNKFLGRKSDDASNKGSKGNSPVLPKKSTSAAIITEKSKKPPRFKSKMFSKSHENLNHKEDEEEHEENEREVRAKSVFPESTENEDLTLESATKDICNHLSQIEINIASRIGDMSQKTSDAPKTITSPNSSMVPTISYSLTPAVASTKGSSLQESKTRKASPLLLSDSEEMFRKKSSAEYGEDGSITPTESGNESSFSGLEDIKEAEDESVMDRITRKSYYSRFNDTKRKPKPKRIDSMETMDQQLAAAKARLLQGDPEGMGTIRDSITPHRLTSASPTIVWDGVTRRSGNTKTGPRTTSLPPENGMDLYFGGIRNHQINTPIPDGMMMPMQNHSSERNDPVLYRSNSGTRNDQIPYRRQMSTNLDDVLNLKRLSSGSRDDPSFHIRQPSTLGDEDVNYRLPTVVNDESPTYRRLSSAMKDEPLTYRRSSVTKDDSKPYRRLSSTHADEHSSETQIPSTLRENVGLKRLSASSHDDDSGFHSLHNTNSSDEQGYSKYASNRDSLNLQYGRNERPSDAGSRSPSVSPSITLNMRPLENMDTEEESGRYEQLKLASAAGRAAGEAAASAVTMNNTERIPNPVSLKPPGEAAAVTSAREELTRRLTPLTRLSNMGKRETSSVRPYRRTVTSGCLPISQAESSKPIVERPSYRRTATTMDLPPTDPRIRTTDYRRMVQDPTRRFNGVRSTDDRSESQLMSHLPSMTSSLPSRSSYSSYSPTSLSLSYAPPSVHTILRRSSLYRY